MGCTARGTAAAPHSCVVAMARWSSSDRSCTRCSTSRRSVDAPPSSRRRLRSRLGRACDDDQVVAARRQARRARLSSRAASEGAAAPQPAARAALEGARHEPACHDVADRGRSRSCSIPSSSCPWSPGSSRWSGSCCSTRESRPAPRRHSTGPGCCCSCSCSRSPRPASTSSAMQSRAATAARRRAAWGWGSTWSGRRSTPTSPTRTGCRVATGCASTSAASTSTPLIAVATTCIWLAWRVDALLLLIALQLLMMVKNLSPVIRSDGYHILADATGVPDLYAHIGATLRRLVPGHHREPSALTGRARAARHGLGAGHRPGAAESRGRRHPPASAHDHERVGRAAVRSPAPFPVKRRAATSSPCSRRASACSHCSSRSSAAS